MYAVLHAIMCAVFQIVRCSPCHNALQLEEEVREMVQWADTPGKKGKLNLSADWQVAEILYDR